MSPDQAPNDEVQRDEQTGPSTDLALLIALLGGGPTDASLAFADALDRSPTEAASSNE